MTKQAHTPTPYLTAERMSSLRQYLADVAAGVDSVIAWNAHKARL